MRCAGPRRQSVRSLHPGTDEAWPPEDPQKRELRDHYGASDDDTPVQLPEGGPWTYANGGPNPGLRASSQRLRQRHQHSGYPPYHPMYGQDPPEDEDARSSVSSDDFPGRVRRGSEGYEVRPVNRDAILRRYVASRGEDVVGRYNVYEPEPHSESEPEEQGVPQDNEPYDAGPVVMSP